jgi:hypothetical protein
MDDFLRFGARIPVGEINSKSRLDEERESLVVPGREQSERAP